MGANAQTSVPTFTAGEVLTAANMNISARTGVPVFATTATRDAAFGGTGEKTLAEGQTCYIEAAPKRLQIYNGTAWLDYDAEFTSFTPTFTNYTRGNGTSVASYVRLGKFVYLYVSETLGSTSSVTGGIAMTLPITASSRQAIQPAPLFMEDTGTNLFFGFISPDSTTQISLTSANSSTAYLTFGLVNATTPFTWTNTDIFKFGLVYQAA